MARSLQSRNRSLWEKDKLYFYSMDFNDIADLDMLLIVTLLKYAHTQMTAV